MAGLGGGLLKGVSVMLSATMSRFGLQKLDA
jgi:hypothetical protein